MDWNPQTSLKNIFCENVPLPCVAVKIFGSSEIWVCRKNFWFCRFLVKIPPMSPSCISKIGSPGFKGDICNFQSNTNQVLQLKFATLLYKLNTLVCFKNAIEVLRRLKRQTGISWGKVQVHCRQLFCSIDHWSAIWRYWYAFDQLRWHKR